MLQSRGVVGVKSLPTVSYLIDYGLTECRGIIMIVKKLRDKNDWSQEQLAEYSDLNVRTIQRVENKLTRHP